MTVEVPPSLVPAPRSAGRATCHAPSPRREPAPRTSHAAPRVLIILPAFNEERCVGRVIDEVREVLPDASVLIVDDASSDGTAAVARSKDVPVLTLPNNLGVGGAMRAGYKYAVRGAYDVAVQLDADGQHDPRSVPEMLDALQTADVVIGARFAGAGTYEVRGPRRWAMRCLARFVSRRTRAELTDATSGLRACNRAAMQLFSVDYPAEYLGDTVEALLIAARAGLRVRQVPVQMRQRMEGQPSQNTLRSTLYLLRAAMAMSVSSLRVDAAPARALTAAGS